MVGEVEVDNLSPGIVEQTMEVEGDTNLTENRGKEGEFLLGDPSYEDIEKGHMRCLATRHEVMERQKLVELVSLMKRWPSRNLLLICSNKIPIQSGIPLQTQRMNQTRMSLKDFDLAGP